MQKWKVPVIWETQGYIEVEAETRSDATAIAVMQVKSASPTGAENMIPGSVRVAGLPTQAKFQNYLRSTICVDTETYVYVETALKEKLPHSQDVRFVYTATFEKGFTMDIFCQGKRHTNLEITEKLYNAAGKKLAERKVNTFGGKHILEHKDMIFECNIVPCLE